VSDISKKKGVPLYHLENMSNTSALAEGNVETYLAASSQAAGAQCGPGLAFEPIDVAGCGLGFNEPITPVAYPNLFSGHTPRVNVDRLYPPRLNDGFQ
jgi:hypothetical protein